MIVALVIIFFCGVIVGILSDRKKPSGEIQVWNEGGTPYLFLSLDISMNELADNDGKELTFKVDWSHFNDVR